MEFTPFYSEKCIKRFNNLEEAELFKIQCIINGNTIIKQYSDFSNYGTFYTDIYYYKTNQKRKRSFMTVQEVITKNKIEDFDIHFRNALGFSINNPDPNIIAKLTVKSISIDYIRQTADISVVVN